VQPAFHSKNKSAASLIPKLDLSKLKRDVDLEDEMEQEEESEDTDKQDLNLLDEIQDNFSSNFQLKEFVC
jgi:hypothetical protein